MTGGALAVWVSGVLRAGTLLSAAIIAVGVVAGSSSVILVGMFVLTLTPAAELATAAAAFVRGGERRYALIASGACALLLGALALAVAVTTGTGS